MYKYLVIDGYLNGTGIRDYYEGGYIRPSNLKLSVDIIKRLEVWLSKYENEHYNGFSNKEAVRRLDEEGKEIALAIKNELVESKIQYCSAATLEKDII